jgi:hypothetical protein
MSDTALTVLINAVRETAHPLTAATPLKRPAFSPSLFHHLGFDAQPKSGPTPCLYLTKERSS